ncbi:MAG: C25 family cysteine peptidase [Proteobacteria bacterium]|nr:C25 family cysteine peptidase [Pseudomonadota bacterium]
MKRGITRYRVTVRQYLLVVFMVCALGSAQAFAQDSGAAITTIQDTGKEMVLEFSMPSYAIVASPLQRYQDLSIEGCSIIAQPGAPGVAVKGQLIDIPEGYNIEVTAQPLEKIETVEEGESGTKNIRDEYRADAGIYGADALFPGQLAKGEVAGYLRDRRVASVIFYPVQYNPVTRLLVLHKRYRVSIRFTLAAGSNGKTASVEQRSASAPAGAGEPLFSRIYASLLSNYTPVEEPLRALPQSKSAVTMQTQAAAGAQKIKAVVKEEGIYKISYEDLSALGMDLSAATDENLAVENQGTEIAAYRSGSGSLKSGDYILFYGVPFKSLYTKQNVYWVYQGSGNGKRMAAIDGNPVNGYPVLQTFKSSYHAEEDKKYWESIPDGEGVDHWFWERLQPTEATVAAANFPVSLKNFSTSSGNFSMKVNLRGETSLAHHTKVYVNGTMVADFTWSGQVELTQDIANISPAVFSNGSNTIKIEEILDSGTSVDRMYVNWFELNYVDTYVAENDVLKFQAEGSGGAGIQVSNFSAATIWVFDVTDPVNVSRIQNPDISGSNVLHFEDNLSGTKRYYALTAGNFKSPAEIVLDEPSNLKSPRTDIDYIIITHESFYDASQQLKNYRASRGLSVEVVKIQDIYDEFSYGLKDARAIKDFLSYAYNNWNASGHPAYVLLVGDASLDYRDDAGKFAAGNVDFVPTYLYQTDNLGDTPTDNWFVCVNGTDAIPDMIIGRMSVKTVEDVTNIIEKVIAYEGEAAGDWSNRVILAADNGFETASDKLVSLLPAPYTPEKVYLSTYANVQAATTDLVNKINDGSLLTTYTGHGSVDNWAGEFLFHTPDDKDSVPRNDVDRLTNEYGLTFVLTLNCLNGFFPNFLDKYSLAEEFVRAPKKGAIACLAPTGIGYPSDHDALAEKIFSRLFTDHDNIAGSVAYTAKINAYAQRPSREILETFTFFGDPATELKISSPSPTTTTTTATTTTTTVPGGLCPAAAAMGKGSPQLMTVYALRDNVLSKTTVGKASVAAYYQHAPEISAIFASRPELKAKAQKLMLQLLPAFGNMIAQRNTRISRATLQSGTSLIDSLSRFAGPALQRYLMNLKADIQRGTLLKQFRVAVQ